MDTVKLGKYMTACPVGTAGHETYIVKNNRSGHMIGHFEWHPRWKQYVFEGETAAAFSHDCLQELARFCERINGSPG